ncbi:hypothetical protein [Ochrobactrum sp. Marseille-Q0166]|uniref:hypothetical protein n=1 Tax=Ochrobactrum sp. Marseille-Q0166 TaxID=2761105 RepID=UPI001655854A|nr:hypothetical protein [Ochrobactrum sp. Marseille-Q0166]MBC8717010.1 hypothetical protein [Ochrobactrum sp. Marseille-Q0166]
MKPNMNKAHLSMMLLLAGLLAACNSTESALNVQGAGQQPGQTAAPTAAQPATSQPATAQPATPAARTASLKPGKLYIAPIIGAPVNVVTPLTHRLNDDARAKGVELSGNSGTDAAYVMKGYFSVLSEDNQTTVLYVWDVMDAKGNRLHRIQGQEKVPGAAADSWSIVPPSAMQSIADKTMQEYSSWLAANRA